MKRPAVLGIAAFVPAPVLFGTRSGGRKEPDAAVIIRRAIERHGSGILDHAVVELRLFGTDFRVVHDGGEFHYEHIHGEDDEEGPRREIIDNDGIYVREEGKDARPAPTAPGSSPSSGPSTNADAGAHKTSRRRGEKGAS